MNNNFNNFNNMDDLFNQLMGGMRGYSSENRRYLINGREVTPEEFAQYRATGQLPRNAESDVQMQQHASDMKQDGVLAKLGRNLTAEAREVSWILLSDETRKFKKHLKSSHAVPRTILFWSEMQVLVRQQLSKAWRKPL